MSAHSCSSVLKKFMRSLAHCALLWHSLQEFSQHSPGQLGPQQCCTIMGNILSLGNEGAWTHTLLQLVGRSCAIHTLPRPGTGLAMASAGNKFPENGFSA